VNKGVYPLAAAMINGLNRIDTISNNLANANTAGFKEDNLAQGSFNNYLINAEQNKYVPKSLQQTSTDNSLSSNIQKSKLLTAHNLNTTINTIPKIDEKYMNQEMGKITVTENNLDFALKDPDTFFKITLPNNETVLTRDGQFMVSKDNTIVTKEGYAVMGTNAQPLQANADVASNIAIVRTGFDNIQKIGNNNFRILNDQNTQNIEPNKANLIQGAVEKSNVNTINAMIGLIEAQRTFELSQKAVLTIDTLNDRSINKVGSNQ
jgi:flagellar basal-body rod protein FlgG